MSTRGTGEMAQLLQEAAVSAEDRVQSQYLITACDSSPKGSNGSLGYICMYIRAYVYIYSYMCINGIFSTAYGLRQPQDLRTDLLWERRDNHQIVTGSFSSISTSCHSLSSALPV